MNNFHFSEINLLAILVAWIIHIALGLIWFQPKLFGNEWSRLTGKEMKPAPQWIIPAFLGHLVMILVLAVIINLTNSYTGLDGLIIGLLAWIGFIVPMETGELVWEKIPFRLFLLRIGNQLIGMAVSGLILGAWQ
jgi:UDP-N-acetylmuramyl pentapeptide phosphotransferase/UDP-N-acetylglucosamine-1-phosphate transferase